MLERILCVDDEPNVLAGYQRQLRKQFAIEVAQGAEEGLRAARRGGFAVIVSDMRMPGMNGAQFLARAREVAPDSVRMLLTGLTDQQTAIAAVNEGHVFRFLTKPCPPEAFARALEAGVEQHRLIKAEKELLEQTVRGIIQVLTEVLSLVNPVAFGRGVRVRRLVRQLAEILQVEDVWRLEAAAMLSQVGCITVPESVLVHVFQNANPSPQDLGVFEKHPRVGADLIRKIPRLEGVAEIIAHQDSHFDGASPQGGTRGASIPLGSRILKVALDLDGLEAQVHSRARAVARLRYRAGWYDPAVLEALDRLPPEEKAFESKAISVRDMRCGMILGEDVLGVNGAVLLRKGLEISETFLHRLQSMAARALIREPIKVMLPQ